VADTCWGNVSNCWLAGYDIVIHLYIEEFKLCVQVTSQNLSLELLISLYHILWVEICALLVASLLNYNNYDQM